MMSLDFDDTIFENLKDSLVGIFPEIIDVFFEETELALDEFKNKIPVEKWKEIKEISHKIKSSSKTFGAIGLAEILEKIESQELKSISHVLDLHESLMNEYGLVKKHILKKST